MRYRLGEVVFDTEHRVLRRGERTTPLSPKAVRLLELLVLASPEPASQDELYGGLWPGTFVEPGNLHNLIAEIRRVAEDPAFIKTLHRFGYALADRVEALSRARFALVAGRDRIELPDGHTIIGRDQLEAGDVSRRHARIAVDGLSATIEDLGSKNGTFIGRPRVERPMPLQDGDVVIFGRTKTRFVLTAAAKTTITAAPTSGSRG
jgi:DNA-binding winged helix-turn-helix (wHTH) protein